MNRVYWTAISCAVTSVFITAALSASAAPLAAASQDKEEDPETFEPYRQILPPIRHYVSSQGELIAPNPEISKNFLSRFKVDLKSTLDFSARGRAAVEKTSADVKNLMNTPHDSMMPCLENKTVRIEMKFPGSEESDFVFSDYLVVPRADLPNKVEGAFGQNVMLFVYDFDDPKSPVTDIARGLGASCVPFRIRGTGRYVYRHFGKEALRNYDEVPTKDPKGKKERS